MHEWKNRFLTLIVVVLVLGIVAGAYAKNRSDDSATCPEGQTLQAFDTKAGKDTLHAEQPDLPEGYTIEDTVSGSGADYSVRSDGDSVTLSVNPGMGRVELEVRCE